MPLNFWNVNTVSSWNVALTGFTSSGNGPGWKESENHYLFFQYFVLGNVTIACYNTLEFFSIWSLSAASTGINDYSHCE